MFDKINILKKKNYIPDTILDIGAHHGNWTINMASIYPNSQYYLFEGIDYPELYRFDNIDNVNVYNAVLNDKPEYVNWYQKKNTGDSIFKEKTIHFQDCEIIKKKTIDLDSFILQNELKIKDSDNILIKIDCQGAEIPILKGSTSILEKTDFIILEIPLFGNFNEGVPDFLEHIKFMDSIGFVSYDIVDNHYINGFNMQIDMLFINKSHNFNNIVNELLMK
jgi:hypothetical protein